MALIIVENAVVSNIALLDLLEDVGPDSGVDLLILSEVLRPQFDDLSESASCL